MRVKNWALRGAAAFLTLESVLKPFGHVHWGELCLGVAVGLASLLPDKQ